MSSSAGMTPEQEAERDARCARVMASRPIVDGEYITASDASHILSLSNKGFYLPESQGKSVCKWLVEIGLLQTTMRHRSRVYFKSPPPPKISQAWVPDNGIPIGRYFPCAG